MTLPAGTLLGVYEIQSPLGVGGMGEVYRARDTRLGRDVAIKVLPEVFAADPDRLARFDQEAKVLASLNHPNIAAIYGLERREGQEGREGSASCIIMELVEGPTLEQILADSGLPLQRALPIARQIAEALEAAHDQGIIHRDLKPANVKVRADGTVKVLDFGLAKIADAGRPGEYGAGYLTQSPTITSPAMTHAGLILGTAAYMSPEQAAGLPIDRRADIWSFGVVMWESLTGTRLFGGATIAHTLADVLKTDVAFNKLPAETPKAIEDILRRCLDRDPRTRLRDIGEARIAIGTHLASPNPARTLEPVLSKSRSSMLAWIATTIATASALALGYVAYQHMSEKAPAPIRLSLLPPADGFFGARAIPTLSPDGQRVVISAAVEGKSGLWVRELDALSARLLPGTENGTYPFWSPDGRTVAFFDNNKLKKIDVAGSSTVTVCDAPNAPHGGTWTREGKDIIVFATSAALLQVPGTGGAATPATQLDKAAGEIAHRWPMFLPDGRHVLYVSMNVTSAKNAIAVVELGSNKPQQVMLAATPNSNVAVLPDFLLFVRERTLFAQPFDASTLHTSGEAVPIAEGIDNGGGGQGQFSVSATGTLVYSAGGFDASVVQLQLFDRAGKLLGPVGAYSSLRSWPTISPDGITVATDRRDPAGTAIDIWLHDLKRGTTSRFTFGPSSNFFPVWNPEGNSLAFYSLRDGVGHVFQRALNARKDESMNPALGDPPRNTRPVDWSRDGRYLVEELAPSSSTSQADIWVLPMFGDKKPFPYLETPFNEQNSKLAPDGKWITYSSDETQQSEVYVQAFPTPGGKVQISTEGGDKPFWSRDGKELYFIDPDRRLIAVDVKAGPRFQAGAPKILFQTRIGTGEDTRIDVSADGRFLIPISDQQAGVSPLTVVLNWQAALKK